MSALQVWGLDQFLTRPSAVVEDEDEDKEAFKAHMEALCADVL